MTTPETTPLTNQPDSSDQLEFLKFNAELADRFGDLNEPQTPAQLLESAKLFMTAVEEKPDQEVYSTEKARYIGENLVGLNLEVEEVQEKSISQIVEDINSAKTPFEAKRSWVTKKGEPSQRKKIQEVVDVTAVEDGLDNLADALLLSGRTDERILEDILNADSKLGVKLTDTEKDKIFERIALTQEEYLDAKLDLDDANTTLYNKLDEYLDNNKTSDVKGFFVDNDGKVSEEFDSYNIQLQRISQSLSPEAKKLYDRRVNRQSELQNVVTSLYSDRNARKLPNPITPKNKPVPTPSPKNKKPTSPAVPLPAPKGPNKPLPAPKAGDISFDNPKELEQLRLKKVEKAVSDYAEAIKSDLNRQSSLDNVIDKRNHVLRSARKEAVKFYKENANRDRDFKKSINGVAYSRVIAEMTREEYKNSDDVEEKVKRELTRLKARIDGAEQRVKNPKGVRKLLAKLKS